MREHKRKREAKVLESEVASINAKEKLEEAKFFLEKLRSLQSLPQDVEMQRESHCYLSAFLSPSVSVIDCLLEDYNVKFSLHIPLTERLDPNIFEREAKRTGNQPALQFLAWWIKERKTLKDKPIGKLLIGKRHINIHRVQTKPDLAKIVATDYIHVSESVVVRKLQEGKEVEIYRSPEQPPPKPKATEATFDWFFSEYPDEPAIIVCGKFLDMVESFVSEAEKRFP